MSVVFPLFSTPLYYDNINLNDSLRVESLEYDEASHAHISKDQFIFDNTSFLDIRDIVETHLTRYIGEELRIDGSLQLTHTSSWVCRHRRGDRSQQHLHSNSMFSGILYLQCDEDSGDIEFSIPHIIPTYTSSTLNLQHHVVENNVLNSRTWRKTPEPGDLFLFPSHLSHEAFPSESDIDRYCIAFNYVLTGKYDVSSGYLNFRHERLH